MEHRLIVVPAAIARASIARHWLGPERHAEPLGTITLRPHQRDAVARVLAILERRRVALLADDVGLGKTYVALAVARGASDPLIVAPAALRDMWRSAFDATDVHVPIVTYEQLSRRAPSDARHDLVVLDEAHHARTPTTQRHERLARLTSGARVLLLSATPIHNRRSDLTALLALALGRSAHALSDEEVAAHVVRRTHHDVLTEPLPAVASNEVIRVPDDSWTLGRLLALPAPLPARGAGDGGALLAWTLVRLWASTRGALRAALRRRVERGIALLNALQSGVHPTVAELASWQCADGAVQLAFGELLAAPTAPHELPALREAVERHIRAVDALRRELGTHPDPDVARAAAIEAIRSRSPDERCIVFTQFADSANTIWKLLRNTGGVCALTGRGAEVAGGFISRSEALRRFAPTANGAPAPPIRDRIDLLISTDLLSEGVNLQDASTVINLDLPWTHARLAQRVGRVRRMGSRHATVRVHSFVPPAAADRLLEVERRLSDKLRVAARTVGVAGAILPSLAPPPDEPSPSRAAESLRSRIRGWLGPLCQVEPQPGCASAIPIAALAGERTAALAVVRLGDGTAALVSIDGGRATDSPEHVAAVVEAINGAPEITANADEFLPAIRIAERWGDARAAERRAAGGLSIASPACRAVLRRLSTIVASASRSERALAASLAERARRVAGAAIGTGGELVLGQLAAAPLADDAWLRAVAAFADVHESPPVEDGRVRVEALVLLLAGRAEPPSVGTADSQL